MPAAQEATPPRTATFDDEAVLERCRRGEMQAFGSLVAKYQDRIYNVILRICHHSADAEELAQETFLKAFEKLGTFGSHSRFYTWLFRIAVNTAISHRRHSERIQFRPLAETDPADPPLGASERAKAGRSAPEEAAMTREAHQRVLLALETLEEEFRIVVVLRDIEEMDYMQIAQVLKVPVGTVKSRLHRGRSLLREKLAGLIS